MSYTVHEAFATTSERGLRHDILPMRLYHKAKKLGIWDPRSIDFTQPPETPACFAGRPRRSSLLGALGNLGGSYAVLFIVTFACRCLWLPIDTRILTLL